jgi:hypothetical protein
MKIFRSTGTAQGNLNELSSGNLRGGLARQSGTSLISATGVILQSHNYTVDTFLVLQAVKRYLDNDLYFVGGYHKDSCTTSGNLLIPYTYPVIGRMDSMGNVLDAQHYILNADNCMNTAGDLEVMSDGGVITWGTSSTRFFALKAAHNGNPVWAKKFNRTGAFSFIKELPGGDLLAGINMDTAGAVIARMGASGNFIWCKSYIRPNGMVHDALVESDNSFIITGFTDSTASTNPFDPLPLEFQPKLFIMKLNGDGNVQWCRGYDSAPDYWYSRRASNITRTLDGNYAVLSTLGVAGYNLWMRPLLMKTNTNGDTLWTRSNGWPNYTYEAMDLLAYSDGSFIYNGRIWGDLPEGQSNFAFLYKTDSLGHLPCQERYHPIEILDLFPTDSSFTLTSADGAIALPAYIQDTLYPSVTQYDGCTFNPTGIRPYHLTARKINVHPNPTTGHFSMQFNDPLMADSYYSVYDTMGRLLFQRPLPKAKETEEVDLSRFSKGTYVIKFTDKEGTCFERVVVE